MAASTTPQSGAVAAMGPRLSLLPGNGTAARRPTTPYRGRTSGTALYAAIDTVPPDGPGPRGAPPPLVPREPLTAVRRPGRRAAPPPGADPRARWRRCGEGALPRHVGDGVVPRPPPPEPVEEVAGQLGR